MLKFKIKQFDVKQGFTLLETLVSLLILSMIIVIISTSLVTNSSHREDVRYFQSRVNISNRMEMIDSIKVSLAVKDITLKTDYTLNDIGFETDINGSSEYVVNCNYYPLSVQGQEVFLSYLDSLPTKPTSYDRTYSENNVEKTKSLPTITLADNIMYAGFYVRIGTDPESNTTSIVSTFNRNIDTAEVFKINDTIFSNYYINKNLKYTNVDSLLLLDTTNETTEYTRDLDLLNNKMTKGGS